MEMQSNEYQPLKTVKDIEKIRLKTKKDDHERKIYLIRQTCNPSTTIAHWQTTETFIKCCRKEAKKERSYIHLQREDKTTQRQWNCSLRIEVRINVHYAVENNPY